MKDKLFIQLPEDERDEMLWGVWNSDDKEWRERGSLLTVDLVVLAEQSQRCETIVIVPSAKVSYKQVYTPAKQLKQIQLAVPYALEDQLANPIDQLHFAFGKRDKDGQIDVFWLTHEIMEHWLSWFEQAEVKVDRLVSELGLIKTFDDASEIILKDHFAIISENDGRVWSCQRDLLPMLWHKQTADLSDDSNDNDESLSANVLRLFHFGELESFWAEQEFIVSQPFTADEYFDAICQEFSRTTVNLLQQRYVPKRESNLQLKKYTSALWSCAFAFIVFLAYQGSQFYVLSAENAVLREQGEQYFSRVFSRRPRGSDLLGQTQRLLQKSNQSGSDGEFLKLLNLTASQIISLDTIKPTAITYDGRKSELRMDVLAPDYQSLNSFRDELVKTGLAVDMSSASSQGELYSTRLVIRSGS